MSNVRPAMYRRVSTLKQAKHGTSLEEQYERDVRFCREQGWPDPVDYCDDGVSGGKESRRDLDRLLEACRTGLHNVVVSGAFSRNARDMRISLNLDHLFASYGVKLIDVDQPNADETARLVTHLVDHLFWRTVRTNTMRGVQTTAKQGYWASGKPPYGWKVVPAPDHEKRKVLAFHEQEAATLREAVRLVVDERMSCWDAADHLNAHGHRTREGVRWGHSNLRRVLRMTHLAGEYELHLKAGDRGTFTYHGPQIIPVERMQELHKLLADTKRPRPPGRFYPLTGLVRGYCGNPYHGLYRPDCKLAQYVCRTSKPSGRERKATCACPRLEAAWLESVVWEQVAGLLSDPDRLVRLAQEYLDFRPAQLQDEANQINTLDRKIAAKQRERTNVVLATAAAGPEAVADAIEQLTREIETLEAHREQAREWAQANAHRADLVRDVHAMVATAQASLANPTPELQREWYKRLDVRVQIVGEPVWVRRRGRGGRGRRVGLDITGALPLFQECPRTAPIPGVANTVAVVERGPRVQPVAMRLDARSGRWLVTELWY